MVRMVTYEHLQNNCSLVLIITSIEVELQYVLKFDVTCNKNYEIKTITLCGKFCSKNHTYHFNKTGDW